MSIFCLELYHQKSPLHCPDNSAYHNRQFNQLLAMRLILQSSSRTQNTTRFPSYSSCSSPNHTISSKLYIPVVTLTFSVLLYHYSDLQARAIPDKYHLSLQRKFYTLDASIGCKLEMYKWKMNKLTETPLKFVCCMFQCMTHPIRELL